MALAQIGLGGNGHRARLMRGNDFRGLPRPHKITRIDLIQGNIGQTLGQGPGLRSSPPIERDVGPALNPLVLVPVRFAVANEIDDGNGSPPCRGYHLSLRTIAASEARRLVKQSHSRRISREIAAAQAPRNDGGYLCAFAGGL